MPAKDVEDTKDLTNLWIFVETLTGLLRGKYSILNGTFKNQSGQKENEGKMKETILASSQVDYTLG